ncbi:MAG: ABC transporter permease [Bacillota bacterium]|nr:ABC transporter permease [Bacillota bacterium]
MSDKNYGRTIIAERAFNTKRFFLRWEWMLVVLLVIINIYNSINAPGYWGTGLLTYGVRDFMDKAIMVFPMMLVLLLGEIDVSVASTMALSCVIMGMVYGEGSTGVPMWAAILAGLFIGAVCGFINGLILVAFKELSSVIVTISTMIIFRGIAQILLETRSSGKFASWFQYLNYGQVGIIPFDIIFFAIETIIFAYVIHKTPFGRRVYAMGSNITTARYSGINTGGIKLLIFTLNGLFAAVAGMFAASKMSSVLPSMAKNYELDVISMVVLGGVSTLGGKGNVLGVVLATFAVGMIRYGLGLAGVNSQTILVIVGLMLIIAVSVPNFKKTFGESALIKKFSKSKLA